MQRILDPAQIEAFAQRAIPRVRLPDPADVFSRRAERLRKLSSGHSLGGYLGLMAAVSDAQQVALGTPAFEGHTFTGLHPADRVSPSAQRLEQAHRHRMPPLLASGWPREPRWREILAGLCGAVATLPGFPSAVRAICDRLGRQPEAQLEKQADLILTASGEGADTETAPFIMAALQVVWVQMAASLPAGVAKDLAGEPLEVGSPGAERTRAIDALSGVCPVCGTLPVASIVRSDKQYQGYRYLHCALCSTEWHLVRIKCSHCQATEGIRYHHVEGGSEAVRAESCDGCRTYRKILYQEKDPGVEAVADDLGSLALDLLMTEDGYHRSSGNPLLWQTA